MDPDTSWELIVEARKYWQKGLDKLDSYIRAHSRDAASDLTGGMKIVYQVVREHSNQRRIARKRVIRFAKPVMQTAYPDNQSIEPTIQNALRRLIDKGLLVKAGYGAYRLP